MQWSIISGRYYETGWVSYGGGARKERSCDGAGMGILTIKWSRVGAVELKTVMQPNYV